MDTFEIRILGGQPLGAPGHMTEPQVEEVIRRLVCRQLSEDDIVSASLFTDDPKHYILLDRVEDPTIIQMGTNPYIIARLEE